jgi:hypothetical protein
MNPFKSVGARLSFALVAVVALALGLVYMIVVPSLRQRLIEAKLNQLENVMPLIAAQVSHTQLFDFTTEAPVWSGRADARVVVYTNTNPASTASKVSLSIFADSNPNSSVDLSSDPVAQRAANTLTEVSGTVHRGNTEWVEVARPVSMGGRSLRRIPVVFRLAPRCAGECRHGPAPHARGGRSCAPARAVRGLRPRVPLRAPDQAPGGRSRAHCGRSVRPAGRR